MCSGCFPIYQPNLSSQQAKLASNLVVEEQSSSDQLAHCEPGQGDESLQQLTQKGALHPEEFGGCLWCQSEEENDQLVVEGSLDSLFEDLSSIDPKEESLNSLFIAAIESIDSKEKKVVEECCICYDAIDTNKNNCVTECGHKFCFKCLATAMQHSSACPCCRSPLVESSETSDDEDDEDDEDESINDSETELEQQYEDNDAECEIEQLSARLEANGFKMQDILSMLLGRYAKGSSDAVIYEMNKKFDEMVDEADNEVVENIEMGKEDTLSNEVVMV